MNVNITSITTISGSAGGSTGEADVTLRVKGKANDVEAVRRYVERACVKAQRRERVWNESSFTLAAAQQDQIKRGDIVRAYDFPGMRDDCYVEGVVTEREQDRVLIHILRDVAEGEEELVGPRLTCWSPLGVSSMSGAPCVFLQQKREKEII